jgi:hypothetical protein
LFGCEGSEISFAFSYVEDDLTALALDGQVTCPYRGAERRSLVADVLNFEDEATDLAIWIVFADSDPECGTTD